MKKMICICLCLVVLLAGCSTEKGAQDAFDAMMQDLKSGDIAKVSPWFDMEAYLEKLTDENQAALEHALLSLLADMDYEIVSAKEEAEGVTVTAKVTMADFSCIIEAFLQKLTETVNDPAYGAKVALMEDEAYQTLLVDLMLQVLSQEDLATCEKTLSAPMVKQEGAWVLKDGSTPFLGQLFSDVSDTLLSLI